MNASRPYHARRPDDPPRRSPCSRCGRGLIWIKSATTRSPVPLDPEQVVVRDAEHYVLAGRRPPTNLFVRNAAGYVALVARPAPGAVGYVSHFATCPHADDFRRPRRQAPALPPPEPASSAPPDGPPDPPPAQLSLGL